MTRRKTYLSIIIPAHNSGRTIGRLLEAIFFEKRKDLEVIVVDDGSSDATVREVKRFAYISKAVRLIKTARKRGPSSARNLGAKKAKGEVLLFLDSDVIPHKGTISEVIKSFKEDKYRVAMTGVWDKKQESGGLFSKFKALRDWSYWVNEKRVGAYYYLFSTRIAAIRRDVFEKLGGFDEKFKEATVEDIEFTYKIAKNYRVDFNEKMIVSHEFGGFLPIAKKYFRRSFEWMELFLGRKKFDPVATTSSEAMTSLSGVGLTFTFILGFFNVLFFQLFFLLLIFHLRGVRKFLFFVYKEEGILFAIYSFFVGILLYHFIFAGAVWALIKNFMKD